MYTYVYIIHIYIKEVHLDCCVAVYYGGGSFMHWNSLISIRWLKPVVNSNGFKIQSRLPWSSFLSFSLSLSFLRTQIVLLRDCWTFFFSLFNEPVGLYWVSTFTHFHVIIMLIMRSKHLLHLIPLYNSNNIT